VVKTVRVALLDCFCEWFLFIFSFLTYKFFFSVCFFEQGESCASFCVFEGGSPICSLFRDRMVFGWLFGGLSCTLISSVG